MGDLGTDDLKARDSAKKKKKKQRLQAGCLLTGFSKENNNHSFNQHRVGGISTCCVPGPGAMTDATYITPFGRQNMCTRVLSPSHTRYDKPEIRCPFDDDEAEAQRSSRVTCPRLRNGVPPALPARPSDVTCWVRRVKEAAKGRIATFTGLC